MGHLDLVMFKVIWDQSANCDFSENIIVSLYAYSYDSFSTKRLTDVSCNSRHKCYVLKFLPNPMRNFNFCLFSLPYDILCRFFCMDLNKHTRKIIFIWCTCHNTNIWPVTRKWVVLSRSKVETRGNQQNINRVPLNLVVFKVIWAIRWNCFKRAYNPKAVRCEANLN